jgi:tRNA (guanine-N7-)-methyltransferase
MIEYEFGVPIPGTILPPEQWTRTALKRLPPVGPLDWSTLFGRDAPVVLDLGCGNGRFTLASALRRPHLNHMAVDLLPVVIRYATRRANQRGLEHVRFAVKDAETFVARYTASGSVAEVHLYHPQPFHDHRQSHLRLVTPWFLAEIHRALAPRGSLYLQTDNPEYWKHFQSVVPEFFEFTPQDGPWPEDPAGRTRREILARSSGLAVFRGVGTRRDDLDPASIPGLVQRLPWPRFVSKGPWCDLDRVELESPPKTPGDTRERPFR